MHFGLWLHVAVEKAAEMMVSSGHVKRSGLELGLGKWFSQLTHAVTIVILHHIVKVIWQRLEGFGQHLTICRAEVKPPHNPPKVCQTRQLVSSDALS